MTSESKKTILKGSAHLQEGTNEPSENLQDSTSKIIEAFSKVNWVPMSEGASCHGCQSTDILRSIMIFSGPYGGSVRCNACGNVESFTTYLGKEIFKVEPLVGSTMSIYGQEPNAVP